MSDEARERVLRALALGRMVAVPFWLLQLAVWGRDLWTAGLPAGFWDPLPLALLWPAPVSPTGMALLWWTASASALLVGAGLWTRGATVVTAVSGAFLGSALMSYGKLGHSSQILVVLLAAMAFSDWGARLSVDSARASRRGTQPPTTGLPLLGAAYAAGAVIGLSYLGSALNKLRRGAILDGTFLADFLAYGQRLAEATGLSAPAWQEAAVDWLIAHPEVPWLLGIAALALEAAAILAAFSPRLALVAWGGVIALHGAIGVLSPLRFPTQAGAALALALPMAAALRAGPRGPVVPLEARAPSSGWLHPLWTVGFVGAAALTAFALGGMPGRRALGVEPVADALWALTGWTGGFAFQAASLLAGTAILLVGAVGCLRVLAAAVRGPLTEPGTETVLLYDGGCGFCKRWCDWSQRRTGASIRYEACQSAVGVRARAGIPEASCLHAAFFVASRGGHVVEVRRGAGAVNAVLRRFPGPSRLVWRLVGSAYLLNGVRQAEDIGYRWVAANRHRLGDDACALPAKAEA